MDLSAPDVVETEPAPALDLDAVAPVTGRLTAQAWRRLGVAAAVVVLLAGAVAVINGGGGTGPGLETVGLEVDDGDKQIIIGDVDTITTLTTTTTTTPPLQVVLTPEGPDNGPGVDVAPDGVTLLARAEPPPSGSASAPDGEPPGPPLPFASDADGYPELVFVLVIGSDARPGQDIARTRADSIHVVAVDPASGHGTIVGIPRDAWVDVPGKGKQKINSALVYGGPQLLAETVTDLTGMPIGYYVVTGFEGLEELTDDLGGVDVYVDRRMDDPNSGAHFDRGWHHFDGREALAFSRNRKDTAYGDFSRSANHGVLMLATLAKMRAEIGDEGGLQKWLRALQDHVQLDIDTGDLFRLAVTARRADPAGVDNVVASGTVGRSSDGQSVVFLDDAAHAMFADVREDGVIGEAPPPTTRPPSTTSTTRPGSDITLFPGPTSTTTPGGTTTTTRPLLDLDP